MSSSESQVPAVELRPRRWAGLGWAGLNAVVLVVQAREIASAREAITILNVDRTGGKE